MGDEVFVFGKLKESKPRTMDHPETEVIEGGEEVSSTSIASRRFIRSRRSATTLAARVDLESARKFENQIVEPKPAPDLKIFPTHANAIRMIIFLKNLQTQKSRATAGVE